MPLISMVWRWLAEPSTGRYARLPVQRPHSWLYGLLLTGLAAGASNGAVAATSANANSPLGINLESLNYYTPEQPLLNIFHEASNWSTYDAKGNGTNEEQYLNLDADGYPITLTAVNDPNPQVFASVGVLVNRDLPATPNGNYPGGQYVVLYDGQGTLSYKFDASLVSSAPGRDVISVTPTTGGIYLSIVATDPNHNGNYLRNIRLVLAANEGALNAGQVFNPQFLSLMKNFRALRFMDWLSTNGNPLTSWANRPLSSNAFWGTKNGVPLEVAIQLANALSADAWLNVPIGVDDNYFTQMATLVKAQLAGNLKAYVELSNEVWNGSFSQEHYSVAQGKIAFPTQSNQWTAGTEWYGMRVAQMADIWFGVYGAADFNSRVVIVMGSQGANPSVLKTALATPDWTGAGNAPAASHHIGAAAIAPYFMQVPAAADLTAMLASADGGISELIGTGYGQGNYPSVPVGGYIGQITKWVSENVSVASGYGIPVVAYEGGQGLEGFPHYLDGSPAVNLFISMNQSAQIIPLYAAYFAAWKAAGGTLFMHFNDVSNYGQYGEWGALQSIMQTVTPLSSAPPKWQALQNFISSTPCWWPGCSGATGPVPMAPSNLAVK